MEEMDISIGNAKTRIKYDNEEQKNLFSSIARELNIEYNKITVNLNCNIDEIVLLSFLLFKTGMKLCGLLNEKAENDAFLFIKSISKYIQQSRMNINMTDGEKILELEKTKEKLIAANIIKKIELNSKKSKNLESNADNECISLISNFTEEIKSNIKNLENKILSY